MQIVFRAKYNHDAVKKARINFNNFFQKQWFLEFTIFLSTQFLTSILQFFSSLLFASKNEEIYLRERFSTDIGPVPLICINLKSTSPYRAVTIRPIFHDKPRNYNASHLLDIYVIKTTPWKALCFFLFRPPCLK